MIDLLGATVAAVVAGAPSQAIADPVAVRAAVEYCLSVAEAEVTSAAPIAAGPEGFERQEGRYGELHWLRGEPKTPGSVAVSPGDGRMCTVVVNDFASSEIAPWFSARTDYFPANEDGTGFVRAVRGGWVRIGWSGEEFGQTTMIIVQAMKETD
ncbi:hypothetical protein [uncultured Brevundimonas sp.]|uniref:hypothetical protein n=1 Tax=uncultured Brevundimonas sp. TaxID=213418 RepID=UPI002599ABA8|nr:hypothetical protein [uncultured Brevundimonas sp.]